MKRSKTHGIEVLRGVMKMTQRETPPHASPVEVFRADGTRDEERTQELQALLITRTTEAERERWRKHDSRQRIRWERRRARLKAVAFEPVARQEIIDRDNKQCYLCGKTCVDAEIHIDHIIPISKGGPHKAANLAVTCADCNLRKGDNLTNKRPVNLMTATELVSIRRGALHSTSR